VIVYVCNPRTLEDEAGRLRVQDQSRIHSKTLSQMKKEEKNKNREVAQYTYTRQFPFLF
jgi:hypothetical protein